MPNTQTKADLTKPLDNFNPESLMGLGEKMTGDQVYYLAILMVVGSLVCVLMLFACFWCLGPATQAKISVWKARENKMLEMDLEKQKEKSKEKVSYFN